MFFQKDVGLNTWSGSYFTLTIFSIFTLIILPLQHYLKRYLHDNVFNFPFAVYAEFYMA